MSNKFEVGKTYVVLKDFYIHKGTEERVRKAFMTMQGVFE